MHRKGDRLSGGARCLPRMKNSTSAEFLLRQPFKIRRLGHCSLNLLNMGDGVRFYTDLLGFRIADVIDNSKRAAQPELLAGLGDPNGYFTRYGVDHHAMVLFS
jgi:hypothetical protein